MTSTVTAQPSARGWLARLRAGECSARELVAHYFGLIDAVNPPLNAVVAEDREDALRAADRADRERRAGSTRPLLGLPITVKDSLDVVGLPSTGGSVARANVFPQRDAVAVARLREAGCLILGKTNLPEYSWSGECDNAVYGRTNNPFDQERTSGGSSGGEAAILGADASPVGIGTDGGSSIRVPAHYCGVTGLRPTTGRVPETGMWPPTRATGLMDMFCVGPMARYVEDLALLLPIMAGPDGVDPYAVPVTLADPASVEVSTLRVGVYTSDGVATCSDATAAAVKRAAIALEEAGCAVVDAELPDVSSATELFFAAMAADGGDRARTDLAPAGGRHHPSMTALLTAVEPFRQSAAGYFELLDRIFTLRASVRAMFEIHDIVVCPAAGEPAPPHGRLHDMSFEELTRGFNYAPTYSIAGLPVVCLRAGSDGQLPIGVQVVAGPFREHVALAAASAIERALGGFAPPALSGR